jgi:hypothetical protein
MERAPHKQYPEVQPAIGTAEQYGKTYSWLRTRLQRKVQSSRARLVKIKYAERLTDAKKVKWKIRRP